MRIFLIGGMAMACMVCHAQSKSFRNDFDDFLQELHADFDDFRKKINEEYIEFVRNPWKEVESERPIPKPKEDTIPPVVKPIMPNEDRQESVVDDNPIVIDGIIEPEPVVPQPEPIKPIMEVPVIEEKRVSLTFFGTPCQVRFGGNHPIRLCGLSPDDISNALKVLSADEYENLIYDCLEIRRRLQLCDWAYLLLLRMVSDHICTKGSNEAELLMAYLYVQSGYRMRLASDGNRLFLLFACRHLIYELSFCVLDGEMFYSLTTLPDHLYFSDASYLQEQSLSLLISKPMLLANYPSPTKSVSSERYANVRAAFEVNKNLIAFYDSYPNSQYGENPMTRWATYAVTPLHEPVKTELYEQLGRSLEGLNQLNAVNRLLNWVQTGFKYEYDDKVWGHDRAFFAEESLYYPYCDCEDRSILLSRLVRDLLGLDVLLVYSPGHLATAIGFTEQVSGDYIMHDGKKYVIADPTYINALVGSTMPGTDSKSVKVILLK